MAEVHQDPHCLAFMDVHPLSPGHMLLIPRQHVEMLADLPAETRAHLYRVFDLLVAAQRAAGLGTKGTHLLVNDGRATNQHIPHAHLHLIPRYPHDNLRFGGGLLMHLSGIFGRRKGLHELAKTAENIKQYLPAPVPL